MTADSRPDGGPVSSQTALIVRPDQTVGATLYDLEQFSESSLVADPRIAYAGEPVHLRVQPNNGHALEEFECRLRTANGWTGWGPAARLAPLLFPLPGQTVRVVGQIRRNGAASPWLACTVSTDDCLHIYPEPLPPAGSPPVVIEGDEPLLAIPCPDGAVLWYLESNTWRVVRANPFADPYSSTLISNKGHMASVRQVLQPDKDGRLTTASAVDVYDLLAGERLSSFTPAVPMSYPAWLPSVGREGRPSVGREGRPSGEIAVLHRNRRPTPRYSFVSPEQSPFDTKIMDMEGRIKATLPGRLLAVADTGVAAYGYYGSEGIDFVANAHYRQIVGSHVPFSDHAHHCKVLYAPGGRYACITAACDDWYSDDAGKQRCKTHTFHLVTATHGNTEAQGPAWPDDDIPHFLRRARSAPHPWADYAETNPFLLPQYFAPLQFASEFCLWGWRTPHDEKGQRDYNRKVDLALCDWSKAAYLTSIPVIERATDAGWSWTEGSTTLVFADDPLMPAYVAGKVSKGNRTTVGVLSQEDDYHTLRLLDTWLHERTASGTPCATSRRVYVPHLPGYGLVAGCEKETGRVVETLRVSELEPSFQHIGVGVRAIGDVVQFGSTYQGSQFIFRDDRTGKLAPVKRPDSLASLYWLGADGEGRLLFSGEYTEQRAAQMGAASRRLLWLWRTDAQEAIEIALPDERCTGSASACFEAEQKQWLVMYTKTSNDIDEEGKVLLGQTVSAEVFTLSPEGRLSHLRSFTVESYLDNSKLTSTSSFDGVTCRFGLLYTPRFHLTERRPGRLICFGCDTITTWEARTGRVVAESKNALARGMGIPTCLRERPQGGFWAQFGSSWVAFDEHGVPDAGCVLPSGQAPLWSGPVTVFGDSTWA